MTQVRRLASLGAALTLMALLPGCGLRPLYSGGSQGVASQLLSGVEVPPIAGKAGWLVRDALIQRLSATKADAPRYRLEVELDDQISSFGVRRDAGVSRERRTLRARYRLIETATGSIVIDATAGSDAGVDVVSSDYATVAAENTALENLSRTVADQIIARLALHARTPAGQ